MCCATSTPRRSPPRLALTAASYLLYTGYDLAARRYAGHDVPTPRVMLISFIAYTFALNIGAAVGGAGFRLRMYAREGVPLGRITRVIAFCIATNWIGYFVLAGALFASGALVPPPDVPRPRLRTGPGRGMRALGVLMLGIGVAYLVACRTTHGRVFHVRGHHFRFPTPRLALLQIAMATTNWTLMGADRRVLPPPGGGCAGHRRTAARGRRHRASRTSRRASASPKPYSSRCSGIACRRRS